jgi:hypothetical protein
MGRTPPEQGEGPNKEMGRTPPEQGEGPNKEIGLSSVYHPYIVTTQLTGSNALKKKITQLTF